MKRELFTASVGRKTPEEDGELFKILLDAMIPVFDSMQEMVAAADPGLPRRAYKITLEDVDEKDYLS